MLLNQVVIAVFEIFGNKCSFLDHFRVFSSITNVFFELVNARELVGNHFFFHKIFPQQQGQETNSNGLVIIVVASTTFDTTSELTEMQKLSVSARTQQLSVRCYSTSLSRIFVRIAKVREKYVQNKIFFTSFLLIKFFE